MSQPAIAVILGVSRADPDGTPSGHSKANEEFNATLHKNDPIVRGRLHAMKILVVDDHQLFVEGLSLLLRSRLDHSDVLTADNARDALSLIDQHSDIGLLTVDLSMPELDGFALITAINERRLLIPAIIVSATQNVGDIARAMKSGALGYIPKSYDAETTIDAIEQVLQGFTYLPPDIAGQVRSLMRKPAKPVRNARQLALSQRQLTILQLIKDGLSNRAIATTLNIAESTVKSHVGSLFDVLGARNRTECIRRADQFGVFVKHFTDSAH